ncbi:serine O-acetyltransferase [Caballeronia udeis]|nr:serine acetyltransferase [Caballeronia udeis]
MKNLVKTIGMILSAIRLTPHLILLMTRDKAGLIRADIERWSEIYMKDQKLHPTRAFIQLMTIYPEYRNLFYHRVGWLGKIVSPLCRPMNTLFISTDIIGPGLFIQHGFATIIAAKSVGANCWINQQVTIGYSSANDCPTIGDNVTINAGAKVIGGVAIGNNSKVGANAVVVKNVPANSTVVGVPARIVRRDGKRVDEPLS